MTVERRLVGHWALVLTASGRQEVTVTCPRCGWRATMKAYEVVEIDRFLEQRLREHMGGHDTT